MRRLAMLALLGATVTLVMAPAVQANGGKPIFQEKFDDRFVDDPDFFVLDVCGVEVATEFHFFGKFTLFGDMSSKLHVNVDIQTVDPGTGAILLREKDALNVFSEPVVEILDETAGTLTIMFEDTVTGNPFKWLVPGEGVLIRDAGQVTFSGTVVIDLATGDVISFDEEISIKGPHPGLDLSEEEILAIFCGAMAG